MMKTKVNLSGRNSNCDDKMNEKTPMWPRLLGGDQFSVAKETDQREKLMKCVGVRTCLRKNYNINEIAYAYILVIVYL